MRFRLRRAQDLRDAIVKGLGFQAEGLKVSGFDVRDALVGHAVAYEFDIEVGRKVLPVRLLEDVSRWDFVDLPIFRSQADADDTALAEIRRAGRGSIVEPTLPPFQLAGPMELWIQNGDDVRLALPVRSPFCKKLEIDQNGRETPELKEFECPGSNSERHVN